MSEKKKWKKAEVEKKGDAKAGTQEKVTKKSAAPKTLMGGHKKKRHSSEEIMKSMYGEK